jgi:SAM-dependent methyltransferase
MMRTGSQMHEQGNAGSDAAVKEKYLQDLLEELYAQQLVLDPDNAYLVEHGSPVWIANQIRTFHWYRDYLPSAGNVLDWGCNHAPDCCLLRAWFGNLLGLYSCDLIDQHCYEVFHRFAASSYAQLEDPVLLPYPSNFFDAVIGSGVLEHVAMDYESLKELYRVLKPGGALIISYLPNWLSYKEFVRRVVQKRDFHRRLYGKGEATQLLKRCGFYPISVRYHTFFWERWLARVGTGRWEPGLARFLARLLPIHVFSSTLCLVGQKTTVM